MKTLKSLVCLVICISGCREGSSAFGREPRRQVAHSKTQPSTKPAVDSDNAELRALYDADQSDRTSGQIEWKPVSERDAQRQRRVRELLESGYVKTGADFVGSSRVDLQACKLEYSIVSPK